ncbi:MAG: DegT/DnrJ/EryC1/StrS aminotransferase family protein [Deltaproteobacteria bacterium]|nr:DegT/DnrJ/EryC1/StrS aminotransferase family protein [Deltaproteobacteria bacterium]MBW2052540.1 DegT/DnrJ/EryC1/StrS aminotransferase family protein [Deltaproteobacteria bacterium]MBW2140780.1 DegT/DnrJ/EryC1/StrS aminotransferase family protein [Deltaproteobacteria bacterium]MBW2323584.1 DegT/DnrJ/EryC1/StrS aminotransferase family protein [Deltaproteobacteria bacterium]
MSVNSRPINQPFDKIPITRPVFDTSEEEALREVLRSGWLVQGPMVDKFEKLFKGKAKYSVI